MRERRVTRLGTIHGDTQIFGNEGVVKASEIEIGDCLIMGNRVVGKIT